MAGMALLAAPDEMLTTRRSTESSVKTRQKRLHSAAGAARLTASDAAMSPDASVP
jgi:hypothetical protein